jgi:malonyl-CoA O-methyltransferase
LLWSNLGLHTHADPMPVLQHWHKALAVDGFLMFSTFGPDTLKELRGLWGAQGWGPPSQVFRDMHDWGDDLVAAGFADPVMDQETVTLTWADADAALAELRTMGANAHPSRMAGCRTPRWLARVKAALQDRAGPGGRIALSFEIIYGHAFRPAPRARIQPVTAVSLDEMRSLVQSSRR